MKHTINHVVVSSGRRHSCCLCHDDAISSFVWISWSIVLAWVVYKWITK